MAAIPLAGVFRAGPIRSILSRFLYKNVYTNVSENYRCRVQPDKGNLRKNLVYGYSVSLFLV